MHKYKECVQSFDRISEGLENFERVKRTSKIKLLEQR